MPARSTGLGLGDELKSPPIDLQHAHVMRAIPRESAATPLTVRASQ